jgi:polyhydroxyalkanoate synthesis regulator phasin
MTTWIRLSALLCACVLVLPVQADLASVKAEAKPDKRAGKALDNAQDAFKNARDQYLEKGDMKQASAYLDEMMESVQLAYDSLIATGKNPGKSPKNFKKAEIRTRDLLRKLADFRDQMSALDRDGIDKIRESIQKIHDDLLAGIMGDKKDR